MRKSRAKSNTAAVLMILGASAIGNHFPQGARPIDGELGIDVDGRVNGILRAESETTTGIRVSIAIAIGSYNSDAAEDAAISQGTNGSRNFKVITLPSSNSTTDLSAPWEQGVSLPVCDRATLVIRSTDLRTTSTTTYRNRLQRGMTQVLQAKIRPPEPFSNPPQPTFNSHPPLFGPKSRSLPIDGLVGMDSAGRLTGYVAPRRDHFTLAVGFVPGSDLTLERALQILGNATTPGVVPFASFSEETFMRDLTPIGSVPGGVIQAMRGWVVVKEYETGTGYASYSYAEVNAGAPQKWIPTRFPRELPTTSKPMGSSTGSLADILSRSLPIDGAVTHADASGIVSGSITVKPPVGVRTLESIEIASVGLETGDGSETSEELLDKLKRHDPDLSKSFTPISFRTTYKLVTGKPTDQQIRLARGKRVAMLFRYRGSYGLEYFVSIINRSGKPPHGERK